MIQESNLLRKNSLKLDNFIIFEYIRKDKSGGGLFTANHKNFKPVLISEHEKTEILVVVLIAKVIFLIVLF